MQLWPIDIRGPLICYIYDDAPDSENCWMAFQGADGLMVMSRHTRQIQKITRISQVPVTCQGTPLS